MTPAAYLAVGFTQAQADLLAARDEAADTLPVLRAILAAIQGLDVRLGRVETHVEHIDERLGRVETYLRESTGRN